MGKKTDRFWLARQGDVLLIEAGDLVIERVDEATVDASDLRPVLRDHGRVVLAYGEVTGHAHAILDPDVELFDIASAVLAEAERVLRVGLGGATVTHEEHGPIPLAPGLYRVRRQREWTDEDEPLLVAD